MLYTIARTAAKRPTLQHAVPFNGDRTACGLDIRPWSRSYQSQPIPQIICLKCKAYQ